jgi:hypothetical protein
MLSSFAKVNIETNNKLFKFGKADSFANIPVIKRHNNLILTSKES